MADATLHRRELAVAYGRDRRRLAGMVLAALGVEHVLPRGARISLKPNLVVAKPASSGATTGPELAAGVMAYLHDHGWREFAIMESAWLGADTRAAFRACGYEAVAREFGAELIDLKHDETEWVEAGCLKLEICRAALRAEALIDLPVLKAHSQTRLTCVIKNLKGCLPDREKRRFHALGLERPLACLARALPIACAVVDAVEGDLSFEEGGHPAAMDRVFGGFDPVLLDAYAAELIGYAPDEIGYLAGAAALGAGSMDLAQARITALNAAARPARQPAASPRREGLAGRIDAREACSACYGPLLHALARLEEQPRRPEEGRICIGQGYRGLAGEGPGVGQCTSGLKPFLPGCPPTARAIAAFLRSMAASP